MKNKQDAKRRFIIAEVSFFIVIVLILGKCLSEGGVVKGVFIISLASFICGTLLNVIFLFIELRSIRK